MKEMCFLLRANQKSYGFLLNQLREGYNMGRYDYPITTTSALYILIYKEGGIGGNQKSSTYKNSGGRGEIRHKDHMGHTFTKQKGGT